MILYMILYPEVQKQIQDEIDQIVGRYGISGYEVFIERIIGPYFVSKKNPQGLEISFLSKSKLIFNFHFWTIK